MSKHKLKIYTEKDVTARFFPEKVKPARPGSRKQQVRYNHKETLRAFREGRIIGTPVAFRTHRDKKTGELVKRCIKFTITPCEWRRLCTPGVGLQAPLDHESEVRV